MIHTRNRTTGELIPANQISYDQLSDEQKLEIYYARRDNGMMESYRLAIRFGVVRDLKAFGTLIQRLLGELG